MKKYILNLGALMGLFILAGCSSNNVATSENTSNNAPTSAPSTEATEEGQKPSESTTVEKTTNPNEAMFNKLFSEAIKENEEFSINGITAKLIKATTSILFVGDNPNTNSIGIRIYIDYPYGENITQDMFKVVDKNMNEYGHIVADGLDFLGQNRGELGMNSDGSYKTGYIRASVPNDDKFLLKFNDNNKVKYIAFNVIEEE